MNGQANSAYSFLLTLVTSPSVNERPEARCGQAAECGWAAGGQMWISDRMWMGAQASSAYSFTRALAIPLASAILLPWRSCCLGDVAGCGLKRRRTIGLKGGLEEGSDPIAVLAERKAASDEANPYARRRVVLAWQSV